MKKNEGIIIKDGNFSANQLAVGRSAKIIINNQTQDNSLVKNIDYLIKILEKEKNNIENYNDIKKSGETIKKEINKENPDKDILNTLLSMMSNSIPAISVITKAIKVLKESIELFIK